MRLEKQGNATKLMECVSFVSSRVIFCQKTLANTCFLGEDFKKCVGFASQIHSRFPFLVLNYWCRIFPRFACEKIEVCSTNWRSGGSSF